MHYIFTDITVNEAVKDFVCRVTYAMQAVEAANVTAAWKYTETARTPNSTVQECLITSSSDGTGDLISPETELLIAKLRSAVLIPLIYVFGGPTNIINITVFVKQGIRDRVNLCLFSLAVVDLLTTSFFFVIYCEHMFMFNSPDTHGPVFAFFANNKILLFYSSRYGSALLSAIIAVERCCCVFFPFHAKLLFKTKNIAYVVLIGVPIVSFLRLVIMAKYEVVCFFDKRRQLAFMGIYATDFQERYKSFLDFIDGIFYGFIIGMGCPIVVLIATVLTSVKLWQTVAWRKEISSSQVGKEAAVTKMLILLSLQFLVCTMPLVFVRTYALFNTEFSARGRFRLFFLACTNISEVFTQISMSYTFLVYYFASSRYRDTLHSLIKTSWRLKITNVN